MSDDDDDDADFAPKMNDSVSFTPTSASTAATVSTTHTILTSTSSITTTVIPAGSSSGGFVPSASTPEMKSMTLSNIPTTLSALNTESTPSLASTPAPAPLPINFVYLRRAAMPFCIHDAVEKGDVDFLRQYLPLTINGAVNPLAHGFPPNIDQQDYDRCRPLHVAILNAQLEALTVLLENGADTMYSVDGVSPIHMALHMSAFARYREFSLHAVELLLRYDADPNKLDDLRRTALSLCAQYDNAPAFTTILSHPSFFATEATRVDKDGDTILHTAARFGSSEVLRLILSHSPGLVHARNTRGFTPLHTLNYYHPPTSVFYHTISTLLLQHGSDVNAQDGVRRTPHHWSLLNHPVADMASPHSTASPGLTNPPPVACCISWSRYCFDHITAPSFRRGTAEHPPPENVRRLQVLLNATDGILRSEEFSPVSTPASRVSLETRAAPAAMVDILRCHEYAYIERIQEASKGIQSARPPYDLTMRNTLDAVLPSDLTPAQQLLYAASDEAGKQALLESAAEVEVPIDYLDADTAISAHSFTSALYAAGVVCDAVDKVAAGETRTAFCVIRPPGHHSGPMGIVHTDKKRYGSSHGFCLLNNVAIGAAYAMCVHRKTPFASYISKPVGNAAIATSATPATTPSSSSRGVKRVAIIDFDVHHGNGTEAIVRNLVPTVQESSYNDELSTVLLRRPSYKPWRDALDRENVFFASVHGLGEEGPWFYPGSGPTTEGVAEAVRKAVTRPSQLPAELLDVVGEQTCETETFSCVNLDAGFEQQAPTGGDKESGDGKTFTGKIHRPSRDEFGRVIREGENGEMKIDKDPVVPIATLNCANMPVSNVINVGLDQMRPVHIWRQAWRHAILPKLLEHKPDMIFISAGFDAHRRDDVNLGYLGVDESDFYWLTKQLIKVANTVCEGRIVSVLEGGYRINGKLASAFSQSVAAHVRALSEGCNETWDEEVANYEREQEDAAEIEARRKQEEAKRVYHMKRQLDLQQQEVHQMELQLQRQQHGQESGQQQEQVQEHRQDSEPFPKRMHLANGME